jgi:hypothetical protein
MYVEVYDVLNKFIIYLWFSFFSHSNIIVYIELVEIFIFICNGYACGNN